MPNAERVTIEMLLSGVFHAAKGVADAEQALAELSIEKQEHEAALINSYLGSTNPATNKPHSATSAKEAANDHESMMDLRRRRVELERAVTLAKAAHECARLRAWHAARVGDLADVEAA